MSEIPDDIMREAEDIVGGLVGWGQEVDGANYNSAIKIDATVIARALMAERAAQREIDAGIAGRIADEIAADPLKDGLGPHYVADKITAAIRDQALTDGQKKHLRKINESILIAEQEFAIREQKQ